MSQIPPKYDLGALVISDNLDELERALSLGMDVNDFNGADKNALLFAICFGKKDAIKILLNHGANVNVRTVQTEQTALQMAIIAGDIDIVQMLLDNGADISDNNGILTTATDNNLFLLDAVLKTGSAMELFFDPTRSQIIKLLMSHGVQMPDISSDDAEIED